MLYVCSLINTRIDRYFAYNWQMNNFSRINNCLIYEITFAWFLRIEMLNSLRGHNNERSIYQEDFKLFLQVREFIVVAA